VTALVVVTEVFKPLVEAQAKARKIEPHLIVLKHPVGGLNAAELEDRIASAFAAVQREMAAG
jgi:hypothetical protein